MSSREMFEVNGRKVNYSVQLNAPLRNKNAVNWFRQNPHRLQLANIGFEIIKTDGTLATIADITNIQQSLNMWTGQLHSKFMVQGVPVETFTYAHQQQDGVAVKVISALISAGRLRISIRFPYPTGEWTDIGTYYEEDDKHKSHVIRQTGTSATLQHTIDTSSYFAGLRWKGRATVKRKARHQYIVQPLSRDNFELNCEFSASSQPSKQQTFNDIAIQNNEAWKKFWQSGAAVDFSGSIDSAAYELERRIVLSQYLTRIQCAGNYPPQETGLTYNSWYGRPHLEMHWWHGVHFSLWGRHNLLQKSLEWYQKAAANGLALAERQG